MEPDLREIRLCHLKDVVGIGEKNIAPFLVSCHKLMLPFFECLKGLLVIAFYPAGLVKTDRLPAALCSVFVKQTILYDFKLELPDSADDLASVKAVGDRKSVV